MSLEWGMKMLNMEQVFFLLPDDFEGGLADALRAMADYHESDKANSQRELLGDMPESPYEEFKKMVPETRMIGGFSISTLTDVDGETEWVRRKIISIQSDGGVSSLSG